MAHTRIADGVFCVVDIFPAIRFHKIEGIDHGVEDLLLAIGVFDELGLKDLRLLAIIYRDNDLLLKQSFVEANDLDILNIKGVNVDFFNEDLGVGAHSECEQQKGKEEKFEHREKG